MRLIITRHGETEENKLGVFQGHRPGNLSDLGKEQAKKVAERLKNENIDLIFSSDLNRAADTAKEIAKFHPDTPIYFIKELRERHMGEAEGKSKKELGWSSEEDRTKIMEKANAEPISNLVLRAKRFNKSLLDRFLEKNILLVGHKGINSAIIADIVNQEWTEFFRQNPQKNTSITIFEFDKNKYPKQILLDCAKHLED